MRILIWTQGLFRSPKLYTFKMKKYNILFKKTVTTYVTGLPDSRRVFTDFVLIHLQQNIRMNCLYCLEPTCGIQIRIRGSGNAINTPLDSWKGSHRRGGTWLIKCYLVRKCVRNKKNVLYLCFYVTWEEGTGRRKCRGPFPHRWAAWLTYRAQDPANQTARHQPKQSPFTIFP